MGAAKKRKTEFFKQNPFCCFCGGSEAATTEDHVPARSIFDERKWPEGYNFPACKSCNRITRLDEKVVAFLSRIRSSNDGQQTPAQIAEMRRCMAAMHSDYPEAYKSLRPSSNEVRRFLKERGIERTPNTTLSEVPILSIGRPEFIIPIRNFGIKLFCALHYKHTGTIVPVQWVVAMRMITNAQQNLLTEEIFKVLGGRPTLVRSRNELHDQFSYVFAVASERSMSAYLCKFRESFLLMGIIGGNPLPEEFDENPEMGAFQGSPFTHPTPTHAGSFTKRQFGRA